MERVSPILVNHGHGFVLPAGHAAVYLKLTLQSTATRSTLKQYM